VLREVGERAEKPESTMGRNTEGRKIERIGGGTSLPKKVFLEPGMQKLRRKEGEGGSSG